MRCITVSDCIVCPLRRDGVCLFGTDKETILPDEGIPDECPLPEYPQEET